MEALYSLVERLGYHHPIHAPMTHVPIGMVVGAFVFTLAARMTGRSSFLTTARHCTALALIAAIPTIVLGYVDWHHYYAGARMFQIEAKLLLAALLTVFLVASLIALKKESGFRVFQVLLVSVNLLLVGGLGYFGGDLVFKQLTPGKSVDPLTSTRGEELFRQLCANCHPDGGNVLKANLPLRKAPQLETPDTFIGYLRSPKARDGSNTVMPAFSEEKLPKDNADALYLYVRKYLVDSGN
ncbi:MAG: DUF2231 domain-containing protein [Syntrophobacteraceae bacterium]